MALADDLGQSLRPCCFAALPEDLQTLLLESIAEYVHLCIVSCCIEGPLPYQRAVLASCAPTSIKCIQCTICRQADPEALCAARLICRKWRTVISAGYIGALRPASLAAGNPVAAFPAATELDLTDAVAAERFDEAELQALPQQLPHLTALRLPHTGGYL